MARPRLRLRRFLLVLLLALLVALLLGLNDFLPGRWPGGGGGGPIPSRLPHEEAASELQRNLPAPPDPREVSHLQEAEQAFPLDFPTAGVRLEIRGVDGELLREWSGHAIATDGVVLVPRPEGGAQVEDPQDIRGLAISSARGSIDVLSGLKAPATSWVVLYPEKAFNASPTSGATRHRLVDAASGAAIGNVPYQVRTPSAAKGAGGAPPPTRTSGPGGEIDPGATGKPAADELVSLRVQHPAAGGEVLRARILFRPGDPARADLPVQRQTEVQVRGSGKVANTTLALSRARWVDHEGVVRAQEDAGASGTVNLEVSSETLGEGRLEVALRANQTEIWVPQPAPKRNVVSVRVPELRALTLGMATPTGQPLAGFSLRGTYERSPKARRTDVGQPLEIRSTANAQGEVHLWIPSGVGAQFLVEHPDWAPLAVTVDAGQDAPARLDRRVEAGSRLHVEVRGLGGETLAGATVLVRAAVDGMRVERTERTNRAGSAAFSGLPSGPVEILCGAPRHAWRAETADLAAGGARVAVSLGPARPLRLVVSTPAGSPVAGARVEVLADGPGAPMVLDPALPDLETDAAGQLEIDRLPDRLVRLHVSAPRHASQIARAIRPGATTYFLTLPPSP